VKPPRGVSPQPVFASPKDEGENPCHALKRGTKRRARRKKYLRRTKGFFLTKSKLYQSAQEAAIAPIVMPSATAA